MKQWIVRAILVSAAGACLCGVALAVTIAAQQRPTGQAAARPQPPNILLVIGDDMGIETLGSFGVGAETAATPNLDRLAASGVRFNRFWSQPVCSPTRATILTGRYGFRTGVGRPTGDDDVAGTLPERLPNPAGSPREGARGRGAGDGAPGLRLQEFTLPQAFAAHPELGYATAAIGKWHLADRSNGWERHPNLTGFEHFAGGLQGFPNGYFSWIKGVNGRLAGTTGYGPSDQVDDATAWIRGRGDRPWFLWFAFNLPHEPLHLPPRPLWVTDHSNLDPQADPNANPRPYFKAMIEAMDTEIGRLLASLDPAVRARTYVVFMGDNGSTRGTVTAPFAANHAKGTVYEGGINVPLIVVGPGVEKNRASNALVNSVDMFATIMEMAGIVPRTSVPSGPVVDAVSFLPYLAQPDRRSVRQWVYADTFGPGEGVQGGQYAIRSEAYKLVVRAGQEEFYDVASDRSESRNLLAGTLTREQQTAYAALRSQVTALHASEQK